MALSRVPLATYRASHLCPQVSHCMKRAWFSQTTPIAEAFGRPRESFTKPSPMSRIPTKSLLRSLVLTSVMSSNWMLRPSLEILAYITETKSNLLNPDRNPILNKLLRWAVYNQFCAGDNSKEVSRAIKDVRNMGYKGVILAYSKEIVLGVQHPGSTPTTPGVKEYSPSCYEAIEEWKHGTLKTLQMIGTGDFLAVKLTGAGPIAVDAMRAGEPMPQALAVALDEICTETAKQGSRLWFDAEQQILQHGLDNWAISMMRKFNRDGKILIYNTIQGYLKGSKANIDRHITLAAREGWALGVKLVRGAYIEHEVRSLIHNTKEATDRNYDLIADTVISQRLPAGVEDVKFPPAALFLATHNAASAEKAIGIHRKKLASGSPTVYLECGQVQGMADELSCKLVQDYQSGLEDPNETPYPGVFKCLTWGSVSECLGYLHRRAIENRGAVERTQYMLDALKNELKRRITV